MVIWEMFGSVPLKKVYMVLGIEKYSSDPESTWLVKPPGGDVGCVQAMMNLFLSMGVGEGGSLPMLK